MMKMYQNQHKRLTVAVAQQQAQ